MLPGIFKVYPPCRLMFTHGLPWLHLLI